MAADETTAQAMIIEGVAGEPYFVTDGTVVIFLEMRQSALEQRTVELRMRPESAKRLTESLTQVLEALEEFQGERRADEADLPP